MKEVYFSIIFSLLFLQFFISGDNKIETVSENSRCKVTISCKNKKEFYSKKEKVGIQEEKCRFSFGRDLENKEFCLVYTSKLFPVKDNKQTEHNHDFFFGKVKFRPQLARMQIKNEEPVRKQLI